MTLDMLAIVIPSLLLLFMYETYKVVSRRINVPPGPFSLPLVGSLCLYQRDKTAYLPEYLHELTKQYGEIMTVWLLGKPTVILSSMEAVKAAFSENRHDFDSRPDSSLFHLLNRGQGGGIFSEKYNQQWKLQRKLATRAFKSMMDTANLEKEVPEGLQQTLENIAAKSGDPMRFSDYIAIGLYSILTKLITGKRYELDDPEFLLFRNSANSMNWCWDRVQYIERLPFASHYPSWLISILPHGKDLINTISGCFNLVDAKVAERRLEKGKPTTIIQALHTHKELLNKGGETIHTKTFSNIIFEIFAGTETTLFTLMWHFLYMVMFPEVQEQCYKEITTTIGDRPAKVQDRDQMPFLEASILESIRIKPMSPLNSPHSCDVNTELMGYTIPKGSDFFINTYALHFDPTVYPNPDNYDPNNFLNADGTVRRQLDLFTFGVGRRSCPAQNMGKNEMFLIVVTFLQKFQILPIPGVNYTDRPDPNIEVFQLPQPQEVLVKQRV